MQLIRSISVILIFALFASSASAQTPNYYEVSFAEATEHFQNGDYDDARLALTKAIKEAEKFPLADSRGPLATSFLAVVEMKRGRVDKAEELHADAISLLVLSQDENGTDTLLAKIRFAEFYLEEKSYGNAKGLFAEIVNFESPKAYPNYLYLARSQWGLAQAHFEDKNWEQAGRMGYFARVNLQRLYGRDSREAAKPLPIITEAAIRLGNYSYAKLFLDELIALHNAGVIGREDAVKLQRMFTERYRKEQEENLVSARQRITALLVLANHQLAGDDPGYVLTTQEDEDLRKEFNVAEREGLGGSLIDYGTNNDGDVAFAMSENNKILAKAVLGVSMASVNHKEGSLHPSLVMFTTLFFDPKHDTVLEWFNEKSFQPESGLDSLNKLLHDGKMVRFSIDEDNELYIFEFFPSDPDA